MPAAEVPTVESQAGEGAASFVLSRNQEREVKACLPFQFRETDRGWAWHAERANQTASVAPGVEKNTLVISIHDDEAGEEIELWRTELRLTGNWHRRLRQSSGEALVLAQSRQRCPRCGKPVRLRRRGEDSVQFYGCSQFPRCQGSLSIVDHDVEKPA